MKKFAVLLLAIVIITTGLFVVACDKNDVALVVLHPNNGEPNKVIEYDPDIALPEYTLSGKKFAGWYKDAELTEKFNGGELSGRVNLYAKWDDDNGGTTVTDKVVVTFVFNDGVTDITTVTVDKGSCVSLLTPSAREDYTFDGWYTKSSGGERWTNNMSVSNNMYLYAHWTAKAPVTVDLSSVLGKYGDTSTWNFAVNVTVPDTEGTYEDWYEYLGDAVLNRYEDVSGNTCVDYYDMSDYNVWYYYSADENGNYTKYADTTDEFEESYSYSLIIDLYTINSYQFVASGDGYAAQNANEAGSAVLGEYTGYKWNSFTIYLSNGNISKIVAVLSDGSTYTYEFSKYGQIDFTLPEASQGGGDDPLPTEPTGVMDKQVYDADTFDNSNLQERMTKFEDTIGLPSTGTYNALVIPVQFKNDNITADQLAKLEKAFNGSSADTGWESVKTFYQKSSYGKLNLTFDIQPVFQASKTAAEYSQYKENVDIQGDVWEKDGSALILEEALAWCVSQGVDLSKYDFNNDGCIDAVYLIYSEEVDYVEADFYWAYVTWYYGETKFGNLDAYYYLFAGFDFMDENLDKMNGVKVNAETYIHETGHLLGLDDYYDYDTNSGSNQGLGGADMMDNNVGDHGVYSKIMLGWLDPTIVTDTRTITLSSSQSGAHAILIPLNWDNSYFCEYLLIDLYTADGLNAMGASQQNTVLYDGAAYGVRIYYHVTSWAKDPYNNNYGSFTDYNNSNSSIPLIKLVEADGETSLSTSGSSWASESDLWQANDAFSSVFPKYMRNDGKALNFDISIDSVSADSATITVTFNA